MNHVDYLIHDILHNPLHSAYETETLNRINHLNSEQSIYLIQSLSQYLKKTQKQLPTANKNINNQRRINQSKKS